jgi:hypothetical protein
MSISASIVVKQSLYCVILVFTIIFTMFLNYLVNLCNMSQYSWPTSCWPSTKWVLSLWLQFITNLHKQGTLKNLYTMRLTYIPQQELRFFSKTTSLTFDWFL